MGLLAGLYSASTGWQIDASPPTEWDVNFPEKMSQAVWCHPRYRASQPAGEGACSTPHRPTADSNCLSVWDFGVLMSHPSLLSSTPNPTDSSHLCFLLPAISLVSRLHYYITLQTGFLPFNFFLPDLTMSLPC